MDIYWSSGALEEETMNPADEAVGGTYRDGRIILDRPMNWPEGTRVVVQLVPEGHLVDGVWPADGSADGEAEISRRMAESERDEITSEEVAALEAALQEVEEFNSQAVCKNRERNP
jgi:hypothetical protein